MFERSAIETERFEDEAASVMTPEYADQGAQRGFKILRLVGLANEEHEAWT